MIDEARYDSKTVTAAAPFREYSTGQSNFQLFARQQSPWHALARNGHLGQQGSSSEGPADLSPSDWPYTAKVAWQRVDPLGSDQHQGRKVGQSDRPPR